MPIIDKDKYPFAKENARNEVGFLKSDVDHPDVYFANVRTACFHKVVAVYNNVFGGKSVDVVTINNNKMKEKDEENNKVVSHN